MSVAGWLRSLADRLIRRSGDETALEEELAAHVALCARDLERSGVERSEAERQARIELGHRERVKEECREELAGAFFDDLARDLRYGLRMLRRSPGFAAAAIATVAFAVGANTAIFDVVDAALLRPLPYARPNELVAIEDDLPGSNARDVGLSEPEWRDLERSGIFRYVSPTWYDENNLTGGSQPARVPIMSVAPNYFALLGARAQIGRVFDPADRRRGYSGEVVISDGLWRRLFGSDPKILQRSLRLDTDLYGIVGVMPPGFHAPERTVDARTTDVWVATSFSGPPLADHPPRNGRNLPTAIGRLVPGLSIAAAQSRVDALVASLAARYPGDYPPRPGWRVRLVPLKERVVGNVRRALVLLFGAVALVLLIAGVNVANLMLARASARRREIAVRRALGAGRARLARQLMTESVLLFSIGGACGLAILVAARRLLPRLLPASVPQLNSVAVHWSVVVFALAVSMVSGLIFGIAPAFRTGPPGSAAALADAARGSSGSADRVRARRALVVAEFALSLVLMSAATLLLRSFAALRNVEPGFDPRNTIAVRTRMPYPNVVANDHYATAAQEAPFLRELMRRSRTIRGVEQVAIGDAGSIPLEQSQRDLDNAESRFFVTSDDGRFRGGEVFQVERTRVTPEYFHVLGIPLRRGRLFDGRDDENAPPVVLVNDAFARSYWPGSDAVGRRVRSTRANSPWMTVVGVVADTRTDALSQAASPKIYLDLYQSRGKHLAIFLRGNLDAGAIPEAVRTQVQALDPTLPVFGAVALEDARSDSLAERRLTAGIVGLFALTALLLAALGIYGVVAFVVAERRREIGIRVALGAPGVRIFGMVLRQGLGMAFAGAALGLVAAAIASPLMRGLVYGVAPADPATLGAAALLLFGVAAAACTVPARRALRVSPATALRCE